MPIDCKQGLASLSLRRSTSSACLDQFDSLPINVDKRVAVGRVSGPLKWQKLRSAHETVILIVLQPQIRTIFRVECEAAVAYLKNHQLPSGQIPGTSRWPQPNSSGAVSKLALKSSVHCM